MASKRKKKSKYAQDSPTIKKEEETEHRDVDHDGEKGESPAHKRKVFGPSMKKAPMKKKPCPTCKAMPCTCKK